MAGMPAGKLRHRLVIERPVETQDSESGATLVNWETLATVWGAIEPLSAREFIAAQAVTNKVTARITIRRVMGLTAECRIFHESSGKYYNVEGILADVTSGLEYYTLPVSEGVKYQGEDGLS